MTVAARRRATPGSFEFLAIITLCMAVPALSIDLLLPAFPEMRDDFGLAVGATEVSRVITAFFLGLAIGQLVYGPLSDRYGRKRLLYAGLALFVTAALVSTLQTSLTGFVACRFVWGLGVAAPRSLAVAMVRDTFEGERMARIMSLVMATFILVPVFAPLLGSGFLELAPWRGLLWVQVSAGLGLAAWASRLPETLAPADRRSVSPRALVTAAGAVVRNRQTLVFSLAVTAIFGVMTSYLGTAEVVIDEVFGEAGLFPLVFGLLAGVLAVGSLVGARLVVRLGLDGLVRVGAIYLVVAAVGLVTLMVATDSEPPLWAFYGAMAVLLPSLTALMPTCNAAAMAPLGQVAGMGAAIIGAFTTAGGALLGTLTDSAYDGTIVPLVQHMVAYIVVVGVALLVLARPPHAPGEEELAVHEPVNVS